MSKEVKNIIRARNCSFSTAVNLLEISKRYNNVSRETKKERR